MKKPRKPIARSTKPIARKKRPNPVNRKRKVSEFARTYHSEERVLFVKSQVSAASGLWRSGQVMNAHVTNDGTKGAGRKSGYHCIAPLLHEEHVLFDEHRDEFYARFPTFDPVTAAVETETKWLRHSAQSNGVSEI